MTVAKLTPAAATHRGMRRRNNQDAVGYRYPKDPKILEAYGALFIVADGVGGLEAGDQASQMAVDEIVREYYAADASRTIGERLKDAVLAANQSIYIALNQSGATTVVAVVIHENELIAVSAGDSLIFHFRNNQIQQINDVDVVHKGNKDSGALTKALGYRNTLELEVLHLMLAANDQILMCSDGLTLYLKPPQLQQLAQLRDPRDSVRRMINHANTAGGADNISAILINVGDTIEAIEVAKYANNLSVRVAVDTNPLMMQDVPSKPTTQIPMARPASSIDESIFDEKIAMPQPTSTAATPPAPQPPSTSKQQSTKTDNSLLVFIILGVVILAIGAAILGIAFATLGGSGDNGSSEVVITEETVQQSIEPTNASASNETQEDTIGLEVGTILLFDSNILTKNGINSDVDAFLTSPDTPYVVDTITQDNEGRSWYRLLEEDTEQIGWLLETDLPEYSIQGG